MVIELGIKMCRHLLSHCWTQSSILFTLDNAPLNAVDTIGFVSLKFGDEKRKQCCMLEVKTTNGRDRDFRHRAPRRVHR